MQLGPSCCQGLASSVGLLLTSTSVICPKLQLHSIAMQTPPELLLGAILSDLLEG